MKYKKVCPICGEYIESKLFSSREHLIPKSFFHSMPHSFEIYPSDKEYICDAHIFCNSLHGDYSLVKTMLILDSVKKLIGTLKFRILINSKLDSSNKELKALRRVVSMAQKNHGLSLTYLRTRMKLDF